MILIDVQLQYARDTRLVLRDISPDGFMVVAMSGEQVAREYYRRLIERGGDSASITVSSVSGFTNLMAMGYAVATTPSARSGKLWENLSEAVLPLLTARIEAGRKSPRLITGCELYLWRNDWTGVSYIWKDRISGVDVLLA